MAGPSLRQDPTMGEGYGSLSEAWERNAAEWARWTRTPGHDVYHDRLNWPAFCDLLPLAGRRTLEVGCGEGRVGRALNSDGHRVVGIDSSPTLVELAREAGGYEELVCGDAAALPWESQAFDLAIAYMVLHDIDDLPGAVGEVARVLEPGRRFCLAIVHPLNRPPEALEAYFEEHRFAEELELDGLSMTFEGIDRPLQTYTRALAEAGFLIEQLHEPCPAATARAQAPRLAKAAKRPFFLHMRCILQSDR